MNPEIEALKSEMTRNVDILRGLASIVAQLVGTVKTLTDTQALTAADLAQVGPLLSSVKAGNDVAEKLLADARAAAK